MTFGDSLVVRNIAIIERRDNGTYFVSMPSYRTNEVTEKGEPIYRDICNPITKEFREKLFGAFEKEYAAEKTKSKEKADPEPEKKQEKAISKKAKAEKEPALAR